MTIDPECYSLACYFMEDTRGCTEAKLNDLASRIQQAVDDYGQELILADLAAYDDHIEAKIDERRENGGRNA